MKNANAIVPGAIIPTSMDDLGRLCSSLAKAKGFIPAGYVGQPAAIGAAIMTGLELGLAANDGLGGHAVLALHLGRPVEEAEGLGRRQPHSHPLAVGPGGVPPVVGGGGRPGPCGHPSEGGEQKPAETAHSEHLTSSGARRARGGSSPT